MARQTRQRILDASLWDVFVRVRIPYSVPYIVAAQEITGSSSIVSADSESPTAIPIASRTCAAVVLRSP